MGFAKISVLSEDMRINTQGSSSSDVLITGPMGKNKTRGSQYREKNGIISTCILKNV